VLLHVINPSGFTPPEAYLWEDFEGPAHEMLAHLAKQVEEHVAGRVPVSWETARGHVVRTIVERSAKSALVVLQGEDKGALERLVTGQVRYGVASRALAPVVCVPSDWSGEASTGKLVVAGVDDPHPDPSLVRAALAVAAERGLDVRFLHAWWFTEPLDDTAFTMARARDWCRLMENGLRSEVERLTHGDQAPAIEVKAVHARPVEALVEQSRRARLLVLGRRDPRLPFGSHLGPVVRAVLRRAECPVMVVE
jgi:nucleotide-binding universal stress UspA family protein